MATIKEIATRAGVSIGTVDRVLHHRGRVSPETEALIHKIVEELGYKPNSVGQGLALRKKKLKLSFFSVDTQRHPFFEDVLNGAKQKAEELTQYGIEVGFYLLNFWEPIVDYASFETDGIALLGVSGNEQVNQLIDWAQERDVPIVCYNVPMTDRDYLSYVGCDYVQAGKMAAGLCALVSNSKGKIGILSVDDGTVLSFQQRMLGFQQELTARYPEMEIAGIYCDEQIENAAKQMLEEHPQLDSVYLINPGDYRSCQIIRDASQNANIKIITNDLTSRQRQMVKDGLISATICQEPERQGAQSLEILFQYVAHKKEPKERNQFTTLSIHISQNV